MSKVLEDAIKMGEAFQKGFAAGVEEGLKTPAVKRATPTDVIKFNKAQIRRAKVNLENAKNRRDARAVANIRRKIAVYELTISMAEYYQKQGEYIQKQIEDSGF